MESTTWTLFDVSAQLGVSPSAVKKRVANLYIPVERGARGKLIFDERAFALLSQADELLKAGHGFEECRRRLGLDRPEAQALSQGAEEAISPRQPTSAEALAAVVPQAPALHDEDSAPADEPAAPAEPVDESVEALEEPTTEPEEELVAVAPAMPAPAPVHEVSSAPAEAPAARQAHLDTGKLRPLPTPVFLQLGRRKPAAQPAEVLPAAPAATATAAPPAVVSLPPDLVQRLDSTLKLLEEKEKQNQMLQSKLMVAYDEMTKLSATAAAFQERSLNLQHEVTKLQSEIRLLAAPAASKPWWKFWAK